MTRRFRTKLRPTTTRSWKPLVELLETRELLTASPVAFPMFAVNPLVSNVNPPSTAFTPAEISQAYGFNQVSFGSTTGTGAGQTIAIVDAYDDPDIQADLNTFDSQFGLAATTITRTSQTGTSSLPTTDSTGGWELEESLDVEWAHAMAPGAKIVLVETSSAGESDLMAGVKYAATVANVVSMSWGGGEFAGQTGASYDGVFNRAGVAFVASSGDTGAPISWPASSANVLAVGGTTLGLTSSGAYSSESGWSGSGGGPSAYESQPAYQSGVVTQETTKRANPDVSYDANPSTGYAVYDSFNYNNTSYGWVEIGGTSAGAPQWAALIAIADQGRALSGSSAIDATSPQEVMTTLYKSANASDFHDVTSGSSSGSPSYTAGAGYDYVTGLGSPMANLVVQSLDATATPAPSDHLVVSSPTTATAGTSFSVTVTADTSANVADHAYTGTVSFSSTDTQAGLPSSYTFTSADAGSHTFTVTLKTAGAKTVTANDAAHSLTATTGSVTVSPAAASQFAITGLPSSATAGTPVTLTVTAKDAYGNTVSGYTGTVAFTSSDASAVLPASYTFQSSDGGTHSFSVTFKTAGSESLTVTDKGHSSLTATQSGIVVSPAAPSSLGATSVSATEIDLSWTGVSGATGYTIQRSANGTTGWTQIGTTASGVTTFKNTGLAAGTVYYYRVAATVSGSTSSFSNTVNATTKAVAASTTDSIWGNGFTPSEDSYSSGSFELGVKFESGVAGVVSGARFYKQSFMSGTHVGHLWSANGTLLATATFTGETASGWQQVLFSKSVSIAANTVYVISFSSGGGTFGITSNSFNGGAITNGPLTALSGSYGQSGSFPTKNGSGMNFWADVVFTPSVTSSARPAVAMTPAYTPVGGPTAHVSSVSSKVTTHVHGHASHRGVMSPSVSYTPTHGRKGSLFGPRG